jgi:hypothetical protein
MKICPLVAELFGEDRQTDMTKPIVAFRNVANTPKPCSNDKHYRVILRSVYTLKVVHPHCVRSQCHN